MAFVILPLVDFKWLFHEANCSILEHVQVPFILHARQRF